MGKVLQKYEWEKNKSIENSHSFYLDDIAWQFKREHEWMTVCVCVCVFERNGVKMTRWKYFLCEYSFDDDEVYKVKYKVYLLYYENYNLLHLFGKRYANSVSNFTLFVWLLVVHLYPLYLLAFSFGIFQLAQLCKYEIG